MKKKIPWAKKIGWILLISLAGSIVFSVVKLATASETASAEGGRLKSDYVLMLVQCIMGLFVMFLPGLLKKKPRLEIPNYIFVMYYVFLYCAIYLGEVRNFYFVIPYWDSILHGFSAAMLGALGFSLVSILNNDEHITISLSPLFTGIFAFCFALALGAIWEIYEFSFDGLLGLNMQKFRLEDGRALVGRSALADTMKDIIIDSAGALVVSVVGAVTINKKRKKNNQHDRTIR